MPTSDTGLSELVTALNIAVVTSIVLGLTIARFLLFMVKTTNSSGQRHTHPWARGFAEVLESLIVAAMLVFLIVRPFFMQSYFIPSESMEPTLMGHKADPERGIKETVNDHIFVNKLVYAYSKPQRGDIIVFRAPSVADVESRGRGLEPKENILIKRLVGLPGDKIQIKSAMVKDKNGNEVDAYAVFINGKQQIESYIKEPMHSPPVASIYATENELTLEPNQYFVMGDNRNDSNDSRFWGTLEARRVIGKANFIFLPLNRIRYIP